MYSLIHKKACLSSSIYEQLPGNYHHRVQTNKTNKRDLDAEIIGQKPAIQVSVGGGQYFLNCDTLKLTIFTSYMSWILTVTKYSNLSTKTKLSTKK